MVVVTKGAAVVTETDAVVTKGDVVVTKGDAVVTKYDARVTKGPAMMTKGSTVVTKGATVSTNYPGAYRDIGGFVVRAFPGGKLQCPICKNNYRGYFGLKRHTIGAHRPLHKSFCCQMGKCRLKFIDAKSALAHLRKEHKSHNVKKHIKELPFHLGAYFKQLGDD